MQKNGQSVKKLIISRNDFPFTLRYPQETIARFNLSDKYIPNTLHQTLIVNFIVPSLGYWQIGCLWWEAVESCFNFDLKSFLHWKTIGHNIRWIN